MFMGGVSQQKFQYQLQGKSSKTGEKMSRKLVNLVGLAITASVGLVACGNNHEIKDVGLVPAAYGENNHCYYVSDPYEVQNLKLTGLCPTHWTPMKMPSYWLYAHAAFYTSPAYYDVYVPAAERTTYTQTYGESWKKNNWTNIQKNFSKGSWKGMDGKTYSGDEVQKRFAPKS
jgi:hypothetical protein